LLERKEELRSRILLLCVIFIALLVLLFFCFFVVEKEALSLYEEELEEEENLADNTYVHRRTPNTFLNHTYHIHPIPSDTWIRGSYAIDAFNTPRIIIGYGVVSLWHRATSGCDYKATATSWAAIQ
jgi:hypothetical protein